MMRLFLVLSFIIVFVPSFALAQPTGGSGAGTGPSGGTCNLTQYKNSICQTESNCSYTIANSIGATGMYQFMPTTASGLNAYQNAPASCKQMGVSNQGLATNACSGVQEAMMDEFTLKNLSYLQNNCPAAAQAVNSGYVVQGYKVGGRTGKVNCNGQSTCTCPVTWSGLLAGAHLGGAGGICKTISRTVASGTQSSGDVDDGATSRLFYVCEHGGYPVPNAQCSPQSYSTGGGGTISPGPITPWTGPTPSAGVGTNNFNSLADQIKYIWVAALQQMTVQLTTLMIHQIEMIGEFLDAKHQLETQRLMQQKTAQAHKDYHPSEQMCEIGTFVRNLTNSQRRADLTQEALARSMLDRALASGDVKTFYEGSDQETKKRNYISKFCDIEDNRKENAQLCGSSGAPNQQNADINYTQTIDMPLTIPLNLTDNQVTPEEENLFTFLDYIFMQDAFPWKSANTTTLYSFVGPYQDMRSLIAIRGVAQNAFAEIIAKKTEGPDTLAESAGPYMKALLQEMGAAPADIEELMGENPSYYAQMEILTKKIYQNPEFIINLYDKPANVKRIRAAGQAIKTMQDRDIHEALERRMMLISALKALQDRYKQQDLIVREVTPVLNSPAGKPDVTLP